MAEVFRNNQTHSTLLMERERAVQTRRLTVQELRQAVQTLQAEARAREEQLQGERANFAHKKLIQDEKVGVKDNQARAQQERVQHLVEEEERLLQAIAASEQEMQQNAAEMEKRQELQRTLRHMRERVTQLKLQLEERDAAVIKLETRLARQEMATEKRHATVAERFPAYALPRVEEAETAMGLEGTAGESLLLVDEMTL